MKPRQAFTLIEMLVVIAIVAILVSLSATGVLKARQKALGAKSASNFQQVYQFHVIWSTDHEGEIMPAHSVEYGDKHNWGKPMPYYNILDKEGYLENPHESIFAVEEHLRFYIGRGHDFEGRRVNMARNSALGAEFKGSGPAATSFDMLDNPAGTWLLTEGRIQENGKWFWNDIVSVTSNKELPPEYLDGKTYLLFCDGHLEMRWQEEIPTGRWIDELFWSGMD